MSPAAGATEALCPACPSMPHVAMRSRSHQQLPTAAAIPSVTFGDCHSLPWHRYRSGGLGF